MVNINDKFDPVQTTPFSIAYKIRSRIWGIVNATFFRWNFFFMRKYRVAILRSFSAKVDWSCSIDRTATIIAPWNLTMGEKSSIGEYS